MPDLKPAALTLGTILVAALAVLVAAPVAAQTPDGLPPALETVCDAESGAAFGWCNAYCEAMDCELANDGDPLTTPNASANACNKVRTKFQQQTGRDMPCEVTCPCSEDVESFPIWAAYLAGLTSESYCFYDDQYCSLFYPVPGACSPPDHNLTVVLVESFESFVVASSLGIEPIPGPFCGDGSGGILPLTPAQGAECKAQLDAAVVSSGVTCGEFPT